VLRITPCTVVSASIQASAATNTMRSSEYIRSRGVTLVEILVVIAVISTLLGLLLPSLQRTRSTARSVVSTSTVRSLAIVHAAYAGDSRDWLFFPGKPNAIGEVTRFRDGHDSTNPFFGYAETWPLYLGASETETRSPFWNRVHPSYVAFNFPVTCTSFTNREYWNRRTRRYDFRQWTGAALHHVVSPGKKSWLHDQYLYDHFDQVGSGLMPNQRWNAVFFDGSATTAFAAGEGYFNGDGDLPRWPFHVPGQPDGAHTINGLAGFDR
jgi:prepilin-type N-terminal cleavage/methylation domain-containing protein